jgi:hypothetical protein
MLAYRAAHAADPTAELPRWKYSVVTSNSVLRNHLLRWHRVEYAKACHDRTWPGHIQQYVDGVNTGPAASLDTISEFTPELFNEYLVRFLVADDQVGRLDIYSPLHDL